VAQLPRWSGGTRIRAWASSSAADVRSCLAADALTLILRLRTWAADIRLCGILWNTLRRLAESFSLLRKGCWQRRCVDSRVTVIIMMRLLSHG
jgi:hypothetical protein